MYRSNGITVGLGNGFRFSKDNYMFVVIALTEMDMYAQSKLPKTCLKYLRGYWQNISCQNSSDVFKCKYSRYPHRNENKAVHTIFVSTSFEPAMPFACMGTYSRVKECHLFPHGSGGRSFS